MVSSKNWYLRLLSRRLIPLPVAPWDHKMTTLQCQFVSQIVHLLSWKVCAWAPPDLFAGSQLSGYTLSMVAYLAGK